MFSIQWKIWHKMYKWYSWLIKSKFMSLVCDLYSHLKSFGRSNKEMLSLSFKWQVIWHSYIILVIFTGHFLHVYAQLEGHELAIILDSTSHFGEVFLTIKNKYFYKTHSIYSINGQEYITLRIISPFFTCNWHCAINIVL